MKTEMKGGKKEEGKDGQTEAATQKDDHFVLRREPGSWSIVVSMADRGAVQQFEGRMSVGRCLRLRSGRTLFCTLGSSW